METRYTPGYRLLAIRDFVGNLEDRREDSGGADDQVRLFGKLGGIFTRRAELTGHTTRIDEIRETVHAFFA